MGAGRQHQVTTAVELGDGRACWVITWDDDGPRGWCIAPDGATRDEVEALVGAYIDQVGVRRARRALTVPLDLAGRARRIAEALEPTPLEGLDPEPCRHD